MFIIPDVYNTYLFIGVLTCATNSQGQKGTLVIDAALRLNTQPWSTVFQLITYIRKCLLMQIVQTTCMQSYVHLDTHRDKCRFTHTYKEANAYPPHSQDTHAHTHTHTWTHTHTHACTHACMQACVHAHAHAHTTPLPKHTHTQPLSPNTHAHTHKLLEFIRDNKFLAIKVACNINWKQQQ